MIKIGIVGLGGMGTVHYNNYQYIDNCEVVAAVCNTEECKERAKKLNITPYDSVELMVINEQIDVIDICTPTYLHKEFAIKSLKLGKHVIVEKPIALSKKDAEEMYKAASDNGRLLFVAHVVQFTKETEILRDAVKTKKYGRVLDAYFQRISGSPKWVKDNWLFDKNKSGLIPFDLHIHDLDLIISLFGKPQTFSYTSCGREGVGYKDAYRFNYTFGHMSITAEAAWFNANYPFRANWRVYFEEGLLEYLDGKVILYRPHEEPYAYEFVDEIKIPTGINLPATGMFYNELSHFVDCIRKGIPSDRISREQVIATVEILEEIIGRD